MRWDIWRPFRDPFRRHSHPRTLLLQPWHPWSVVAGFSRMPTPTEIIARRNSKTGDTRRSARRGFTPLQCQLPAGDARTNLQYTAFLAYASGYHPRPHNPNSLEKNGPSTPGGAIDGQAIHGPGTRTSRSFYQSRCYSNPENLLIILEPIACEAQRGRIY